MRERADVRKGVGTFGKNKGTFAEKWGTKCKKPCAFCRGDGAAGKRRGSRGERWSICAREGAGRAHGDRKARTGREGVEKKAYLCRRLTYLRHNKLTLFFYDSLPHFGVDCPAHLGWLAPLALPSTDLRALAGAGADGCAHAPPYAPTVGLRPPQSAAPLGINRGIAGVFRALSTACPLFACRSDGGQAVFFAAMAGRVLSAQDFPRLTAVIHGGAGIGVAPNGGRRTDGRLRRPCPPGADGRSGALSDRTALYIMCLAARRHFPLRNMKREAPTGDQAVGGGGFVVGVRRHGGRRFLAFAAALTALFLGVVGGACRFLRGSGRFFGSRSGLLIGGRRAVGGGAALFG